MYRNLLLATATSLLFVSSSALADTVCSGPNQLCTVTIPGNSNAQTSNFGGGPDATTGYTITTSDDGTNFTVVLTNPTDNGLHFANLYFDTIASTPGTGSDLGFEFGSANPDGFIPGVSGSTSLAGSGITSVEVEAAGADTFTVTIPNTFFLYDPLGMGFALTPDGTLVSLHLSQSFGYSVAGGSTDFPAPVELGAAIVGSPDTTSASAVPEPSSFVYMATSGLAMLGAFGRKARRRS
jgi:hypothetical protein